MRFAWEESFSISHPVRASAEERQQRGVEVEAPQTRNPEDPSTEDLTERGDDHHIRRQQREPVGAQHRIVGVDHDVIEERIHRRLERGERLERARQGHRGADAVAVGAHMTHEEDALALVDELRERLRCGAALQERCRIARRSMSCSGTCSGATRWAIRCS